MHQLFGIYQAFFRFAPDRRTNFGFVQKELNAIHFIRFGVCRAPLYGVQDFGRGVLSGAEFAFLYPKSAGMPAKKMAEQQIRRRVLGQGTPLPEKGKKQELCEITQPPWVNVHNFPYINQYPPSRHSHPATGHDLSLTTPRVFIRMGYPDKGIGDSAVVRMNDFY